MHRTADQAQRVAELVLEVAAIGEVQRFVHVREEGEGRRAALQLGDVVEAARAAAQGGGLVAGRGTLEDGVELRSAEAGPETLDDGVDLRKDLLDAGPLFAEMNSSGA